MPSPNQDVTRILTEATQNDKPPSAADLAELSSATAQHVYPLIAALRDDEATMRRAAALGLRVVADAAEDDERFDEPLLKRAIPPLIVVLQEDSDVENRAAAAHVLGAIRGYFSREATRITFADPELEGRVKKMDGPLAVAAQDSNTLVQEAAQHVIETKGVKSKAPVAKDRGSNNQHQPEKVRRPWWKFWEG